DFGKWLEKLAPFNPDPNVYHHNRTGEDNADAHLKRQVMGREVVVAITKGKLDFGPWEQIFYGEFDGHRPNRVLVKGIGEGEPSTDSHVALLESLDSGRFGVRRFIAALESGDAKAAMNRRTPKHAHVKSRIRTSKAASRPPTIGPTTGIHA